MRQVTLRHFDIIYEVDISHQSPLDSVMSFKRITVGINVCKDSHSSQIFDGISTMQWRKAEQY